MPVMFTGPGGDGDISAEGAGSHVGAGPLEDGYRVARAVGGGERGVGMHGEAGGAGEGDVVEFEEEFGDVVVGRADDCEEVGDGDDFRSEGGVAGGRRGDGGEIFGIQGWDRRNTYWPGEEPASPTLGAVAPVGSLPKISTDPVVSWARMA